MRKSPPSSRDRVSRARLRLEILESRLMPGDTVLGALLTRSLFGGNASFLDRGLLDSESLRRGEFTGQYRAVQSRNARPEESASGPRFATSLDARLQQS